MRRIKSREAVRKEVEDKLKKYDIHLDPIDVAFLVHYTHWDINKSDGTTATTDPIVNRGKEISRRVWDIISEKLYEAQGGDHDKT